MNSEIENSLTNRLVKLADALETCDPGDEAHKYYSREYRRVAKALFPDMYPRKKRKPTQLQIKKLLPCKCGIKGFSYVRFKENKCEIKCRNCSRTSGIQDSNENCILFWNKTFDESA